MSPDPLTPLRLGSADVPRAVGPRRAAFPPAVRMLLGCLALAGCTGETVVVAGGGGGGSVFFEHEPNDDAWNADFVGGLRVGDAVAIRGHVTDSAWDPFDGFAFEIEEPLVITLELDADSPFADLDVCVYDPVSDVFVACFEGPHDPEVASVAIGLPAAMHLVVSSWSGASDYTLWVQAEPLGIPAAGPEGEGPASPARFEVDRVDPGPRLAPYRGEELERKPTAVRGWYDPATDTLVLFPSLAGPPVPPASPAD